MTRCLSLLTGTQSVERWLGQLAMVQLKHRANLHICNLESAIKLNVQTFTGRREGQKFDPSCLFESGAMSVARGVHYKASKYALRVQNQYIEWFGEKASAGRSLDQGPSRKETPPLGSMPRVAKGPTLAGLERAQKKAVSSVVVQMSKSESVQEMYEQLVAEQQSVAFARSAQTGAAGIVSAKEAKDWLLQELMRLGNINQNH